MTITTAKLARAVRCAWNGPRRASWPRPLAAPLALAALLCTPAARADWTFTPTLNLRETWTDNVALRDDAQKQSLFVSEVTPGFRLRHKGPRLLLDARYQLQYFAFSESDVAGTNRSARSGQASLRANLVDELFYVDASASKAQQGISPFGQLLNEENNYASANRAEVTSWRVSPYLVHRFGARANAELRYTHDEVDAGRIGLGNTQGDSLSLRLDSGAAFRTVGWGVQLSGQKIQDRVAADSEIKAANLNVRYRIARTVNLTAALGYDKYDYQALGGENGGRAWSTGFTWTPSLRTSLQASFGRRYYGPSRSLTALHRSRHTVWSINYSDSVMSTRSNFLLPATIDTATMLDRLFTPNFADPAERARAVEDYIRITGLPAQLSENVNFFSNRYALQKQLRASMAFKKGRTSAVYSLYRVKRDMLSVRESDSPLLGSNSNTINDNTSQTGFNATLNYRLTPRTYLNLVSDITRNESLSTGISARSSAVRFSMRHQLRARMSGAIEVRHIEGNTALLAGRPYTENAVAASLSMQL